MAADEGPDRLQAAIQKQGAQSLLPWYWRARCSCGAVRCGLRRGSGADGGPDRCAAATSAMCWRLTSWARTRVNSPSRHSGCSRNKASATTRPSTASPRNSSRSLSPPDGCVRRASPFVQLPAHWPGIDASARRSAARASQIHARVPLPVPRELPPRAPRCFAFRPTAVRTSADSELIPATPICARLCRLVGTINPALSKFAYCGFWALCGLRGRLGRGLGLLRSLGSGVVVRIVLVAAVALDRVGGLDAALGSQTRILLTVADGQRQLVLETPDRACSRGRACGPGRCATRPAGAAPCWWPASSGSG